MIEAMGTPAEATPSDPPVPRSARKRQDRARRFLDAALRIVTEHGFEALTMQRLADELDTVVSAVYRYYPSKAAILAAVQVRAVERLQISIEQTREKADAYFEQQNLSDDDAALARLVLIGRWWCATSQSYPEELRLLQMQLSARNTPLDEGGGDMLWSNGMELIGVVASALEDGQRAGVITAGAALDRALIWASGLGGVLQLDDLDKYSAELFGGSRLAVQTNLDLLTAWGGDPTALERVSALIDDLADLGPLAP